MQGSRQSCWLTAKRRQQAEEPPAYVVVSRPPPTEWHAVRTLYSEDLKQTLRAVGTGKTAKRDNWSRTQAVDDRRPAGGRLELRTQSSGDIG